VSWMSLGVPHEPEFFCEFLLALDPDCNACQLVACTLSPCPAQVVLCFCVW
jgi:hypothetical protein